MALRALRIVARSAVVEVGAPFVVVGALDVVAVRVLGEDGEVVMVNRAEAVIGVNNLEVAEVARLAKTGLGKVT